MIKVGGRRALGGDGERGGVVSGGATICRPVQGVAGYYQSTGGIACVGVAGARADVVSIAIVVGEAGNAVEAARTVKGVITTRWVRFETILVAEACAAGAAGEHRANTRTAALE